VPQIVYHLGYTDWLSVTNCIDWWRRMLQSHSYRPRTVISSCCMRRKATDELARAGH